MTDCKRRPSGGLPGRGRPSLRRLGELPRPRDPPRCRGEILRRLRWAVCLASQRSWWWWRRRRRQQQQLRLRRVQPFALWSRRPTESQSRGSRPRGRLPGAPLWGRRPVRPRQRAAQQGQRHRLRAWAALPQRPVGSQRHGNQAPRDAPALEAPHRLVHPCTATSLAASLRELRTPARRLRLCRTSEPRGRLL